MERAAGSFDRREAGFSLLEVMVALAILGMALVAIFGLFSGGLQAARLVKDYDRALLHAQQKMEELNLSPTLRSGVERGEFEDRIYRWETEVSPFTGAGWEEEDDSFARLLQLRVRVAWAARQGERTLELTTLKLMFEQQAAGLAPGAAQPAPAQQPGQPPRSRRAARARTPTTSSAGP